MISMILAMETLFDLLLIFLVKITMISMILAIEVFFDLLSILLSENHDDPRFVSAIHCVQSLVSLRVYI